MVTVTVDLPDDVNRMVEHFKIDNALSDKRDAIVMLLKKSTRNQEQESMEELFAQVNRMKKIKLSPSDIVRMKREIYD